MPAFPDRTGDPPALFDVTRPEVLTLALPDGVRLVADVYRPDAPGPFPVLLMRQPYGRRIASTVVYAHPAWYAARGFLVVVQDVRGTGDSEGEFLAYAAEAEDGAASIAWAASLPGSNGRVGMYGFSYQGAAQTLALSQAPPALHAIAPAMALWDLRAERAGDGFALAGNASWAAQMGAVRARHAGDAEAYAELAAAANTLRFDGPVPADPPVLRRHAGLHHYALWRDAPADDSYWALASSAQRLAGLAPRVPAFFVGGWFDYHLTGTVAGFRALADSASHLLIGPWAHLSWTPNGAGADFGPEATSDVDAQQAAFFAHILADAPRPAWMDGPRVRLFDLTRRVWRSFEQWPDAEPLALHLAGNGLAAVRPDGGWLQGTAPAPGCERFVHDPWRPAPSVGLHHGGGFVDRAGVDARFDIACFTTEPAEAPLPLAGTPRCMLHVSTDAPSFDIHATLSLVLPDGRALALADGMARGTADGPLSVTLRPLCLTVQPGQRLRLSLAGACFPAHAVNPGTGADPLAARADQAVPITFTIRCGGTAPSCLLLPPG